MLSLFIFSKKKIPEKKKNTKGVKQAERTKENRKKKGTPRSFSNFRFLVVFISFSFSNAFITYVVFTTK